MSSGAWTGDDCSAAATSVPYGRRAIDAKPDVATSMGCTAFAPDGLVTSATLATCKIANISFVRIELCGAKRAHFTDATSRELIYTVTVCTPHTHTPRPAWDSHTCPSRLHLTGAVEALSVVLVRRTELHSANPSVNTAFRAPSESDARGGCR